MLHTKQLAVRSIREPIYRMKLLTIQIHLYQLFLGERGAE